jgi:hypothetical protein
MIRILRGSARLFGAVLLTATTAVLAPAPARAITFDIDWTGALGWTLEGAFSYSDALIGTGPITEADLTSFQIEVFLSGVSQGTWDLFVDGETPGFPVNINFDTTTEAFIVGGDTGDPQGQQWNSNGTGTCPNPGIGFASGTLSQGVCANGGVFSGGVVLDESTLTATERTTGVPLPASLLLVIGGLGVAHVVWRRR